MSPVDATLRTFRDHALREGRGRSRSVGTKSFEALMVRQESEGAPLLFIIRGED